jgi:hypothetical protein
MLGGIVGANVLNMPDSAWAAMSLAQQETAMVNLINQAISDGDVIVFASNPALAAAGSGLAYEWQYLQSLGATLQSAGNGAYAVQLP